MACRKTVVLLVLSLLWLSSCGTSSVSSPSVQDELYFVPQILPDLSIPSDVGARSEDPAEESTSIMDGFKEGYAEALLRGIPMTGVLGGDRVNPWPEADALSWSQNWASSDTAANSWGIPGLILALSDYRGAPGTVYAVYGQILHQYGRSAGYNRANGAAGYGIPLGQSFFLRGAAVQRFRRGSIIVAREGSRFQFEEDAVTPLLESLSESEMNREFGGKNIPPEVSTAFAQAWAYAFTDASGKSDGPVTRVNFSRAWELQSEGKPVSAEGFYIKSYNNGKDVFILVDGPQLPVRAHRLSNSILAALVGHKRLPGLERERSLGSSSGGSTLGRSLAGAFAIYGPPLSDSLPWPADQDSDEAAAGPLFLEAQRFSRGWIIAKPALKTEEPEDEEEDSAPEVPAGEPAW